MPACTLGLTWPCIAKLRTTFCPSGDLISCTESSTVSITKFVFVSGPCPSVGNVIDEFIRVFCPSVTECCHVTMLPVNETLYADDHRRVTVRVASGSTLWMMVLLSVYLQSSSDSMHGWLFWTLLYHVVDNIWNPCSVCVVTWFRAPSPLT